MRPCGPRPWAQSASMLPRPESTPPRQGVPWSRQGDGRNSCMGYMKSTLQIAANIHPSDPECTRTHLAGLWASLLLAPLSSSSDKDLTAFPDPFSHPLRRREDGSRQINAVDAKQIIASLSQQSLPSCTSRGAEIMGPQLFAHGIAYNLAAGEHIQGFLPIWYARIQAKRTVE